MLHNIRALTTSNFGVAGSRTFAQTIVLQQHNWTMAWPSDFKVLHKQCIIYLFHLNNDCNMLFPVNQIILKLVFIYLRYTEYAQGLCWTKNTVRTFSTTAVQILSFISFKSSLHNIERFSKLGQWVVSTNSNGTYIKAWSISLLASHGSLKSTRCVYFLS